MLPTKPSHCSERRRRVPPSVASKSFLEQPVGPTVPLGLSSPSRKFSPVWAEARRALAGGTASSFQFPEKGPQGWLEPGHGNPGLSPAVHSGPRKGHCQMLLEQAAKMSRSLFLSLALPTCPPYTPFPPPPTAPLTRSVLPQGLCLGSPATYTAGQAVTSLPIPSPFELS